MRWTVVAAVVSAGLLEGRPARADDPCADDVKRFCAEVQVGSGRVNDCLRKNDAALSPACRERRAAAEARFRQIAETFSAACRSDADRLCSGVKPGRGRIVACLLRQQDDLSSACRDQTDRIQTATETVTTIRAVCKSDVERLCGGVPPEAGPLVDCLRAHRAELSQTCGAVDPEKALVAAELVDAVDTLSSQERSEQALQILQGIESIAFSRSQVLLQVDSYQGFVGTANGNRLLFNPQVAFGSRREFSFQLRVPVLSLYPYAPDQPARTGLGAITTTLVWAFAGSMRIRHYAAFGFQWISPVSAPVGGAWAVNPGYAVTAVLTPALSVTGQVAWIRSFASAGYPELNVLLFDPIVVLNLPGRSFLALDGKLGWNLADSSFVPVLKGVAGLYIDRKKSLSISAWYQRALSSEAEAQTFTFGVGTALAYFFDW